MITLEARASFGNGGKQFIARITGRHSRFTFDREFIGKKGGKRNEYCSADVDEPGLYECRSIGRKGDAEDEYNVIETGLGGEVVCQTCTKEQAMKLAKLMETVSFEVAVDTVWPPKAEQVSQETNNNVDDKKGQ